MPEMIFDDDELQAFWLPGRTPFLLVSFGDLAKMANGRDFLLEKPATKLGMTCLGIMTKRPNWYPRESLHKLWLAVAPWVSGYNERILYGSSMGGHGALKASSIMGASTTISLCPQWSIAPGDGDGLGWADLYRPEIMTGMRIEESDVSGNVFILSDPRDSLDERHLRHLRESLSSPTFLPAWSCGHNLAPILAGTNNLSDLIAFCRSNDAAGALRHVNRVRHPHFLRKKAAIAQGIERRPRLTAALVMRAFSKNDIFYRVIARDLGSKFYKQMHAALSEDEWDKFVRLLIDVTEDAQEKLRLALGFAGRHRVDLTTCFGTRLYFDPLDGQLAHAPSEEVPAYGSPLSFALDDTTLKISASANNCDISLGSFEISQIGPHKFTLNLRGLYMSADPRGSISCDRGAANEWGTFTLEVRDLHQGGAKLGR